eukprot:10215525-Ditylum_brightwellii.AAC.1
MVKIPIEKESQKLIALCTELEKKIKRLGGNQCQCQHQRMTRSQRGFMATQHRKLTTQTTKKQWSDQ